MSRRAKAFAFTALGLMVALICLGAVVTLQSRRGEREKALVPSRRQTCPDPAIGGTSASNRHWRRRDQGGGDSNKEWTDPINWDVTYVPGSNQADRAIIAAGDHPEVNCDTSFLSASWWIDQRSASTIGVYTSLSTGGRWKCWNNARITLFDGASVSTGKEMWSFSGTQPNGCHFTMHPGSSLTTGDHFLLEGNSDLSASGDAILPLGTVSVGDYFRVDTSPIDITIGAAGFQTWDVTGVLTVTNTNIDINARRYNGGLGTMFQADSLVLDSATISLILGDAWIQPFSATGSVEVTNSKLVIDASKFNPSGDLVLPFVSYGSLTSFFAAEDIEIHGLSHLFKTSIVHSGPGAELHISASSPPPGLTLSGVANSVTFSASSSPGPQVVDGLLTIEPNTGLLINCDSCAVQAGTYPLYTFTVVNNGHTRFYSDAINGQHDASEVKLRGFPENSGHWYELRYEATQLSIVIKELHDYVGYAARGEYDPGWVYDMEDLSWWGADWSWDKIPVWRNARRTGTISDDDIAVLAQIPISMIGISPAGFDYNEDGAADTTARIKQVNPSAKVMWYWNSHNAWSNYRAMLTAKDEYYQIDPATGDFVTDANGRRFWNQSNPEMRQWWVDECMGFLKGTYYYPHANGSVFDGVFIDSVSWMTLEQHPDQYAMVQLLYDSMRNDAELSSKLVVGNALRQTQFNGARDKLTFMHSSYMENWLGLLNGQTESQGLRVTIQLAREALSRGRIVMPNSGPWKCGELFESWTCDGISEEDYNAGLRNNLGVFLLMIEQNAYLSYARYPLITASPEDRWNWDSSHLPEFSNTLGEPLGPPIQVGENWMSRQFANLAVTMDLEGYGDATLVWGPQ